MDNIKENLARALHDGLIDEMEVIKIIEDNSEYVCSLWHYDDVRCNDYEPSKSKLKNHDCYKILNYVLENATGEINERIAIAIDDEHYH